MARQLETVQTATATGTLRANERVTPGPGQWRGGWSDDYDIFQLTACESPKGLRCTTLTDLHYPHSCPYGVVVLDPQFAGSYLRVADRRIGAGAAFAMFAVGTPYGGEIWRADRITSAAIVGRIAEASEPTHDQMRPAAVDRDALSGGGGRETPGRTRVNRRPNSR